MDDAGRWHKTPSIDFHWSQLATRLELEINTSSRTKELRVRRRTNVKGNEMNRQMLKKFALVISLAAIVTLGACKKKAAPPPPPPPPPPPTPTASISVSPDTIQQGQSATLSWQTSNATDVSIDGIGAVQASGSQQVNPTDSTTYHLTAKGAGGTQEATTRLTVTQPPP